MKKLSKVQTARRIRDNGYKFQCEYGENCKRCREDDLYYDFCKYKGTIGCNDIIVYVDREAVDNYIKRYSRKPKKVSRPNFVEAIKEKKKFIVRGSLKAIEWLLKRFNLTGKGDKCR